MLALRECLLRESNSSASLNTMSSSVRDDGRDDERKQKSVASKPLSVDFENNLSSSTTANSSCQQQQSQQKPKLYSGHKSQYPSAYSSTASSSQKSNPSSHITTAPAYYTDEYLRIQTPPGSPLALAESESSSINENYRSVYPTPSKLITDDNGQKLFPKSPTATVAPPPIAAKRTIFRHSPPQQGEQQQKTKGDHLPRRSSSSSGTNPETDNNASSVISSHAKFKPVEVGASTSDSQPAPESTSSRSSNAGRFSNKKRVVRVRSDSRPISALYDIICKEKGIELDQDQTMSSGGGVVVGIDSTSVVDTNPTDRRQYQQLQQQQVEGVLDMQHSPSSQLNSSENSNVSCYRIRPLSYQDDNRHCGGDDYGNDNVDTYNRLQMKPDILTTPSYLASELNHYQQFDHNHPDHEREHDHHPHHPHCTEPNLPSSCVDSSLNNYRESSSYVNRNNELSDVHGAAGVGGNQRPATANGHQQMPAPRPTPRVFRDEKRRFTDGMVPIGVRGTKANAAGSGNGIGTVTGTGTGSDGDNGCVGSQPDSLTGVGRRYITRSSRTPGGGGSNNSDSSPSPIPSVSTASSQHRLTPSSPASNSISSNRLRSPLKSPSINRSTVYQHYSAPTSAISPTSGSATINGNGNNHHHYQQQQQEQQQQVDPSRSVMTNSVGAVATAAAAPSTAAAASSLNEICGQSVSSTNKRKEICVNGRLVMKSSSASSIPPNNPQQHHPPSQQHSSQQAGPNHHHHQQPAPAKIVRTTKTSRLRAAALDKKKDSDDQHPSSIPTAFGSRQTSPRHCSRKPSSQSTSNNNSPDITRSIGEHGRARVGLSASPTGGKKLVPSVSVSMRQSLSELHYNGNSGIARREQRPHTTECTVKVAPVKGFNHDEDQFLNGNDDSGDFSTRPRSSTMNSESNRLVAPARSGRDMNLSPVRNSRTPEAQRIEDRDKSSKRKSNLNRSLNDEVIGDDDAALRRRRRRELGMARQLIPSDETSSALRELFLSPRKSTVSPTSPRNDLAFHMENARRGVGLISPSAAERRRAQTASPKIGGTPTSPVKLTESKIPRRPAEREVFSMSLGGRTPTDYSRRNRFRLSDVSQKVDAMRERTKSELAEIKKITEMCNAEPQKEVPMQRPPIKLVPNAVDTFASSLERIAAREDLPRLVEPKELNLSNSSVSPRSFVKKDRISFDDGEDFHSDGASSLGFLRRRMLKARSVEREISLDQPKLSPILRRKSSDEPTNHIVSILKKKDQTESSSASSNASPVTFSSTTVDTPTRTKRQGILKKRSSLDESRYYSRSHSPDERSILVKSARRNSLEETQHGILKQSSYESKSDGCPSAEPHHGILKKKDSTSTPSDSGHPSKHVSISQAVILAAAELCKDIGTSSSSPPNSNDSEYDNIRPILKVDSQEVRAPKPILKKKSSSETEEIRPILKTSRKSSREESSDQSDDQGVRPILKTDSPAKRRSFAEPLDLASNIAFQRSRSLEQPPEEGAVGGAPPLPVAEEKPIISVADLVKNMERFMNASAGRSSDENSPANSSAGAIPKIQRPIGIKREMYKDRFRTQPVTNDEKQCLQAATSGSLDAFKPAFSLDSLNYTEGVAVGASVVPVASTSSATKISPRSLSSISPSPREVSDLFSPRSVTDLNCVSISSDSGLQTGKHFEMSSGLDDSSSKADELSSIGEGVSSGSQRLPRDDSMTLCEDESGMETTGPSGLLRSSSVKARANMFQQLEEKTKANRIMEEKVAVSPIPRRVPRRLSTSPPTPSGEPKTPANAPAATDEEFEPSSLPLAERLRFFSSLSEVSRNSGSTSLPLSRQYHPVIERRGSSSSVIITQPLSAQTTPRSSIVPMDFEEAPPTPTLEETPSSPETTQMPTTPTSTLAPIKRIKLKTVGKLVMPSFFNDRNNNDENSVDNMSTQIEPVKKIGKIKSPFIESSQRSSFPAMNGKTNKCMKYDLKSTPTSNSGKEDDNCDMNADSGKENYDSSLQTVELRKKKVSTSSSSGVSSAPASQRNSFQQSLRSPLVDEKYAKYFGISTNHSCDSRNSTPPMTHKSFDYNNMPDVCRVTPKPHLRQQNFSRSVDEGGFIQKSCSLKEVRIIPPSPVTPSGLSPVQATDTSEVFDESDFGVVNSSLVHQIKRRDASKRTRAMTAFVNTPQSTPERKAPTLRAIRNRSMTIANTMRLPREPQNPITKYEDLKVTKEDLLMASRDFERIFLGVV